MRRGPVSGVLTTAGINALIATALATPSAFTCLLTNTATQAFLEAAGEEVCTWPTEIADPSGMHTGGAPTLITIPANGAGLYIVWSCVTLAGATGINFSLNILSGSDIIARGAGRGGGVLSTPTTQNAIGLAVLAGGAVLTAAVNTETNVSSQASPAMFFGVHRLGPTPA